MLSMKRVAALAAALAIGVGMSGCETTGGAAGAGAGIGALAGAVIGHQSGHALEGAAIGAAVGAASGAVAHDIRSKRARSEQETAEAYNYQPSQGETLRFEGAEVMPASVRPGEMIESRVTYALLGTGGGVQVTETRRMMGQDGRLIAELSSEGFTRGDGTWVSSQNFRLPNNQAPGSYQIETEVRTAKSRISGRANVFVE
ncbi:MAG: hypothetical protein GC168_15740 [Candidatus Hydrogenedens sp.]|nr:hypothetical protein [Candidatus Hydrogenedens sp.]